MRNRVVLIAVCAAVLIAPFFYAPYVDDGPVLCPLHGIVGLPCPSCGMTRAFCALAEGRWRDALSFNALGLPLAALLAIAPLVALWELAFRRRARFYRFLYASRVGWFCAGVVVTYHLARMGWWLRDGTLLESYVRTSWTYALFVQSWQ